MNLKGRVTKLEANQQRAGLCFLAYELPDGRLIPGTPGGRLGPRYMVMPADSEEHAYSMDRISPEEWLARVQRERCAAPG